MEKPPIFNYFATAEQQRDVDLEWIVKWGNEPCPHSTLPAKRKMCDACWQELEKLVEAEDESRKD